MDANIRDVIWLIMLQVVILALAFAVPNVMVSGVPLVGFMILILASIIIRNTRTDRAK